MFCGRESLGFKICNAKPRRPPKHNLLKHTVKINSFFTYVDSKTGLLIALKHDIQCLDAKK